MFNMYQPGGYNQAMPFLPTFPQQQPAQQTPPTNVSWVYVNGVEGARSQIVQPGQTSWMMDNNEPLIYVKTVDGMGTATLKAFRLNEVNAQNSPSEAKGYDLSTYAQKSDLDGILSRIKAIEDVIGGMNT